MTSADDQTDVTDEATAALPNEASVEEQASPAARAVREPLIGRHFTQPGEDVYGQIEWTYRTAAITSDSGETIFEQSDIETPAFWSQTATNIVASKYFWGQVGTDERESSMKTLVDRVVETITRWGRAGGYFSDGAAASAFSQELRYLLINQYAAFNSPVWFNVGVEETPQCSACFINSVEDTMESIMDLAKREALLFKWGSGTGSNLSTLRSSKESLTGGGKASGPVSFMRGYDAFANVIKSGGKTRRAAKMIILDADHPDVMEFINCKADEERKAWALIDSGYDGSLNGDAYSSVSFQNANHSVRVSDEFMQAVEADGMWATREVVGGEVVEQIPAREILRAISAATHQCGDPGMQFDSVINDWHTCSNTDRIYASNPCSEYMFLDDTACNLASLNLLKFYDLETHEFDVESYRHACRVIITAQEILVSNASYPSPLIDENSEKYRPLGLGYTNLGALLMARGLPYDSVAGRALAATVTALMTGEGYLQSARIAERIGAFSGYADNRDPFLRVMRKHQAAVGRIDGLDTVPGAVREAAENAWRQAVALGEQHGYRNAQATVLAPTGTIAFMMDCDTTGVEPDISLVKYKNLSGGGYFKIVNRTVPAALRRLGYAENAIESIGAHIDETGTIEGAADIDAEHLAIFDCAFKAQAGQRSIAPLGHIRMLGAVQPFLSGAVSKTVNVPEHTAVEEIMQTYVDAWKLGAKAVAIYRDNSKRIQPLETGERSGSAVAKDAPVYEPGPSMPTDEPVVLENAASPPAYRRHRLPDERKALTHKFTIGEHEGYMTIGEFEDGRPGEVFVHISKEGSTVSGLMDAVGTLTSVALQSGVPLSTLVKKFAHMRFEPMGWTRNRDIPHADSILDYVFRWMGTKYLEGETTDAIATQAQMAMAPEEVKLADEEAGPAPVTPPVASLPLIDDASTAGFQNQLDAPPCAECGSIMVRSGSCFRCMNCGATSGCS
ncbi:MAG: vitamin B12-dependent ribonucleotide reductase [Chloroflexi bacterium]|nr:vitamin B12-dependent ribonucleotide reductase [Chloroflexota bacterium]MCY3697652.1 vitamin B12-dependent ribonucleotide reductase [Chloroflexota bacterium]